MSNAYFAVATYSQFDLFLKHMMGLQSKLLTSQHFELSLHMLSVRNVNNAIKKT